MTITMFTALRNEVESQGLIPNTQHITTSKQLAISLFCVGHGVTHRILAETF